jgi:uncharacterized protein
VIVVDTGVIFAAADADDPRHGECAELLDSLVSTPLGVTVPVVVESAWLIESRLGPAAEASFLRSLSVGEIGRLDMTDTDWNRVVALIERYTDLGLGVVDASVVAVAERVGATQIATLDRRHFTVVRPSHIPAFELLPMTGVTPTRAAGPRSRIRHCQNTRLHDFGRSYPQISIDAGVSPRQGRWTTTRAPHLRRTAQSIATTTRPRETF